MNYYEELGLPREASVQEIRHAYKVLARLVHPDGHCDEQVRGMAERQMQRLNDILATLTDAQKRRDYDESLLAPPITLEPGTSAPDPRTARSAAKMARLRRQSAARFSQPVEPWRARFPEWATTLLCNWFWVALAVLILCVAGWYVASGNSTPAAVAKTTQVALGQPPPLAPPPHSAPKRKVLPAHEVSRPKAAALPPPNAAEAPPRVVAPANEPDRLLPAPTPEPLPAAPVAAKPEPADVLPQTRPAPCSFAGNWLYVPESGVTAAQGAYPATYMEFLLREADGELTGSYRARFKIPNLALSPEVFFRVLGKSPAGESARLGWTSADGARGEVEMTLRAPNAMRMTWWTTQFGSTASLASGTANLVRQQTQ